jgi:aryl-alcohol dehydrogenase-like predicted oxidoreductase
VPSVTIGVEDLRRARCLLAAVAAGFRRLAAERGESAALLAHRYALSMSDLATVVLGVKNRVELEECLAAEAAGPLADDELQAIEALRGS